MNRREFIRCGIYLAGAFACLPSGVVLAQSNPAAFSFEGKTIHAAALIGDLPEPQYVTWEIELFLA